MPTTQHVVHIQFPNTQLRDYYIETCWPKPWLNSRSSVPGVTKPARGITLQVFCENVYIYYNKRD
jgi:hypothetical protein